MAISPNVGAEDSASEVTEQSAAINEQLALFFQSIHSDDSEGLVAAFYRAVELGGTEVMMAIGAQLNASPLTEQVLAALTKRAETQQTASAWVTLADIALTMGQPESAVKAAQRALQIDPGTPNAALLVSSVANRQGEWDQALRVISDLVARVPAEKDNPRFIIENAVAEINRGEPKAALAVIDPALPLFTAAGLEYRGQVLRARALTCIPERSADAVTAWERAVETGANPEEIDDARDGLVAALARAHRYDEALRQLDLAIATTTSEAKRSSWLQIRPNALLALGNMDGAIAALDDLMAATTAPEARINFRLQQAGVAAAVARWKDVAGYFDEALSEVPADAADASERRRALRMQKVQTVAPNQIDIVLKDLDELDSTWTTPDWPMTIDLRITGLTAAGRVQEALDWLEERLARTPDLANHPAAHQLRADLQIQLGATDEAMKECGRVVELAPTAADARALMAVLKCAFGSQQFNLAVDAYGRLGQVDPAAASDPSVRVIAASSYLRLGDAQTALQLTDDGQPPALSMMVMRGACRCEAQVRLQRYDEALATAAETLEKYQSIKAIAPSIQVPVEYVLLLHTLRAQAFNEKKDFEAARRAASEAIEIPDPPGVVLAGLTAFVRTGAFMQRSLALYLLKKTTEAHEDIDKAINGFEGIRNTPIMRVLERSPGFERFEGALWYAKGSVLESEKRSEESLAAYTRSARIEKHGAAAAIARGYALCKTGAFDEALTAFDTALRRVASPKERSDAFAGKGRALVRLTQYDKAISALQSALDARLTERDDDPGVFEQLGIAYASLQRNGAAKQAFERAWELTPEDKRSANLARGIVAAELRLNNPHAVLNFLDKLPVELANERTLQFNRALALDAIGQRRPAIRCLLAAKQLGLARAQAELDRLDAPLGLGRWTHYWFGAQTRPARLAFGIALVLIAATGLAAPVFQWWINEKFDWYLLLLPSVIALLVLALPNMKSIGFEGAGLTLSVEPLSATGRDAAAVAAPESFEAPTVP